VGFAARAIGKVTSKPRQGRSKRRFMGRRGKFRD
jgi:hypothetical protein